MRTDPSSLSLWMAWVSKIIGPFGEGSTADPYNPYPPVADLRKGWGTPPGFKKKHFMVVEDAADPRLNKEGVERIAFSLRNAASNWISLECRNEDHWACRTPEVLIDTSSDPLKNIQYVRFTLTAYVYPPLAADLETKLEEK